MWEDFKNLLKQGSGFTKLLLANVIIYLIIELTQVFFFLFSANIDFDYFIEFVAVPADLKRLFFHPWSLVTYQFIHKQFGHILYNMLMLYFGGRMFVEFLGEKRIVPLYIVSGICGALLFILFYNIFPAFTPFSSNSVTIGASASVLGIFIAVAAYIPNFVVNVFFVLEVRLKFVALFLVLIDLISLNKGNAGGHIAHLGGAIFGLLYATQLKKGNDLTSFWYSIKSKIQSLFKRKQKLEKVYSNYGSTQATKAKHKQELVDAILDKISRSGYDSLSKQEKEILFNASKES
jgi:membrane associated rhomboid family serine protease